MKYAFIRREHEAHSLSVLCRVLGVSRSGYYEWLRREPSAHSRANRCLLAEIRRVHGEHRGHSG
ncbi:MAG: hypothetical protein ACRES9_00345, partial [Gammaproteobacteria bacterium]